jgi:hypothetical protein
MSEAEQLYLPFTLDIKSNASEYDGVQSSKIHELIRYINDIDESRWTAYGLEGERRVIGEQTKILLEAETRRQTSDFEGAIFSVDRFIETIPLQKPIDFYNDEVADPFDPEALGRPLSQDELQMKYAYEAIKSLRDEESAEKEREKTRLQGAEVIAIVGIQPPIERALAS